MNWYLNRESQCLPSISFNTQTDQTKLFSSCNSVVVVVVVFYSFRSRWLVCFVLFLYWLTGHLLLLQSPDRQARREKCRKRFLNVDYGSIWYAANGQIEWNALYMMALSTFLFITIQNVWTNRFCICAGWQF